jgi:hypothetical protein
MPARSPSPSPTMGQTATGPAPGRGERVILPELADLEVASLLRRQLAAGAVDARRAGLALDDPDADLVRLLRCRVR